MGKIHLFTRTVAATAVCFTAMHQAEAQSVSIYDASYTSAGSVAQTSGTYALNTFTVTGVYNAGSTTNTTLFISDGTANGRIYGSQTSLASLMTVGAQGTASVTDSVFQGTEEFKTPTAVTAAGTTGTSTPVAGMLSMVAATINGTANPFTAGPSDSLYASEAALLFAPVTFTITPNASGTLSTTTTTTLTDAAGYAVLLYKAASAFPYSAGIAYTVTGYEQPYNGSGTLESEMVGVFGFVPAAIPEPSTYMWLGMIGAGLATIARRRRCATA